MAVHNVWTRTHFTSVLLAKQDKEEGTEATEEQQLKEDIVADKDHSLVESQQTSEEDPAVTALKEEIKNAESELKAKKSTLGRIQEDIEKYSKTGYARREAQMEDMRRIRLVGYLLHCATTAGNFLGLGLARSCKKGLYLSEVSVYYDYYLCSNYIKAGINPGSLEMILWSH